MATYVTLVKLTGRGLKDVKDSTKRAADLKTHAKKHGIEVKEQYWCMGAYDGASFLKPRTMRQRLRPCFRSAHGNMSARRRCDRLRLLR